jgi:DNA-binding MarR family transcriptional regulator
MAARRKSFPSEALVIHIVRRYNKGVKGRAAKHVDYKSLAQFRYEIRLFLDFVQRVAREAGIEPQQYQALLAIRGLGAEEKPNVRTLARRMLLQHHSAVELSARLERRGWIARTRGREDRREVLLRLTGRGQRLLDKLSRLHAEELRVRAPRLIQALQAAVPARKKQSKR